MKKSFRLYNVIFPIWLLWIFPITWIYILIINFIIDSSVLLLSAHHLDLDKKMIYTKCIIKTYLFGFLADIIGALFIFGMYMLANHFEALDTVAYALVWNPFESIVALIVCIAGILISAIFIYLLNHQFTFKQLDILEEDKKKMALYLTLFTTPYLFLLPTSLLYL